MPTSEHDRSASTVGQRLTDATGAKDGELRLEIFNSELDDAGYESVLLSLR